MAKERNKGSGRRRKAEPWEWGFTSSVPEVERNGLYRDYKDLFSAWSMARFRWELPDSCSSRFMEQTLFYSGLIVFYWDVRYERYMLAKCTAKQANNLQDDITAVRTVDMPGYKGVSLECYLGHEGREAKENECVVIHCNDLRIPEISRVKRVALTLADLDMSINLAAKALRNSRIAIIGQDQELTYRNLFRKLNEGIPFFTASQTVDPNAITSLDIGGNPQSLKALREERNQYWNQSMIMLGIASANQDKKERLVTDEVAANDQHSTLARLAAINSRRYAVDLIGRAFPEASVSVSWAVEEEQHDQEQREQDTLGVVEQGAAADDNESDRSE